MYQILQLNHEDVDIASELINSSTCVCSDCNVNLELHEQIDNKECLVRKLLYNKNIIGVYSIEFDSEFLGISFIFIIPEYRKTMMSYRFCKDLLSYFTSDLPIYIMTDDTSLFKKYVELIEDNLYILKGLRKNG